MTTAKRRARRIAADEAHSWARNLQLGNIHAKLILTMLSLYVDGEGMAFVSISSLADDCEMSGDTVRRRLAWLEEIGAIGRTAQWLDEYGCRNGNGRGKRTTDLIRLMFDADTDAIEARAAGRDLSMKSTSISPSQQPGLDVEAAASNSQILISPRLGLAQPSHCSQGLISEPEPESPLKSPQGDEREPSTGLVEESEPEDFAPAWSAYPGREVMRRDLALEEFRKLPKEKQGLCRAAVPLFAASLKAHGRTKPPSCHLWIRSRGFEEFPNARVGEAPPTTPAKRFLQGAELDGLRVAVRIAERRELILSQDPQLGAGIWSRRLAQLDRDALAMFADQSPENWDIVELGSAQFAAWRDRLALWLGVEPAAERIFIEPHDPAVHDLPAVHADFRLRKTKQGFRVPAPWPPHRDGTWGNGGTE